MPPYTVSHDIKARVPILHYNLGYSVKEIVKVLGVKKSLIYKTLFFHWIYGLTYNPHSTQQSHRRRHLTAIDISFIRGLLHQKHTIYLDEIQEQLLIRHSVQISLPTLSHTLHRKIRGHQLVDKDGHWKDLNAFRGSVSWEAGGSQYSQSSLSMGLLHMILLKGLWQVSSSFISCESLWYISISVPQLVMLTFSQIPLTNPYPGPWSVLILDNCHIHHAEEIRELVEDEADTSAMLFCTVLQLTHYSGCKLIFLPPYSPDYNPIEQAFSSIKSFLRHHWQDNSLAVMDRACQNITSYKAAGYFYALGYIV